jgi:predicted TIM-barrel fold metal-dependent hydrolase
MIVDFHTHVFSPWAREHRGELLVSEPYFGLLYRRSTARMASHEELLASMEESRVDRSVVLGFGWRSSEVCARENHYLLEAASRSDGRLIPFCMVAPTARDEMAAELRQCAAAGARGMGEIMSDAHHWGEAWLEEMAWLLHTAHAQGLVGLAHASEPVGHSYHGKGTFFPGRIYRLLDQLQEGALVLAHLGGGLPFYGHMPEVRARCGGVFFDTAALPLLYRPAALGAAVAALGADHFLFGSDYPLMPQGRSLRYVGESGLEEGQRQAILGENALRLLSAEFRVPSSESSAAPPH